MEQDANKLTQHQRKFNDTLNNQNIEDCEELIRKIQQQEKMLTDSLQTQQGRLEAFEKKIQEPMAVLKADGSMNESVSHINDAYMVFLRKEIARITACINSTQSLTKKVLQDTLEIKDKSLRSSEVLVSAED